jgi:hypothetical protein
LVLTTPLTCTTGLLAVHAVNPMLWIFLFDLVVENRTDRVLFVTPVGSIGPEGQRFTLPLYHATTRPFPIAVPVMKQGNFKLNPGESIELTYDWDDINFSEIVVRDDAGETRMLVVDPKPTENRYHSPYRSVFVIDSFEALKDSPAQVREAADDYLQIWPGLLAYGAVIPLVLFFLYHRLGTR